jgi:hypothetical protein
LPEKSKDSLFPLNANASIKVDDEGVEKESIGPSDKITKPFDPNLISISTQTPTIDLVLTRIRNGELNLAPDFQRHDGIWSDGAQSRLIESLLMRIPLPAFYVDATDEEHWLVVDGLQRLSTLRRFVIDGDLRLKELEFLSHLDGKTYKELSRNMQRRILETQIIVYSIERKTEAEVKFNIFKRINTGGLPLSAQEIRHALNQGPSTKLLKELAEGKEFLRATSHSINPNRMGDRECVLRFLAFTLTPAELYASKDFDNFLNRAMSALNNKSPDELNSLKIVFWRAMNASHDCFGEFAFRKRYDPTDSKKYPINKALFEVWSVNLGNQSVGQLKSLVLRKEELQSEFCSLMTADRDFEGAISQGTGDPGKVKLRFNKIAGIIEKVLND